MPSYDPRSDKSFPGYNCLGCCIAYKMDLIMPGDASDDDQSLDDQREYDPVISELWYRTDTAESYLAHFAWCKYAQQLWQQNKNKRRDSSLRVRERFYGMFSGE